ncbi:MAG: RidA family protein [Alphaproteobacteria bacterium]
MSKEAKRVGIPDVWDQSDFPMAQAVVEPDGRRVHLTGQVGWGADFNVIGKGDAEKQAHAAIDNIEAVLAGIGGSLEDIVSFTTYYTRQVDLPGIYRAREDRFHRDSGPAVTGIRVAGLVDPDLLVEFAVIAVIPEKRYTG